MITKGIIIQKNGSNTYLVDLPTLESLNEDVGISATTCSVINNPFTFNSGDIVFVDFENNRYDMPVILGALVSDRFSDIDSDVKLNSLSVGSVVSLPPSTKIGDVDKTDLLHLRGLTNNIEEQLSSTDRSISDTTDYLSKESDKTESNRKDIDSISEDLESISNMLDSIRKAIGDKEDSDNTTIYGRFNSISQEINSLQYLLSDIDSRTTAVDMINEAMEEFGKEE